MNLRKKVTDMPEFMRIFSYHIYFWSNENKPLEPIHVHISEGTPHSDATKYWINSDGTITQDNNNSRIPQKDLKRIEKTITTYTQDIVKMWEEYFKQPATYKDQSPPKVKNSIDIDR